MASEDPLVELLKDVRRRIRAGEIDKVLDEANKGGDQAKWLLVKVEAKLHMELPEEATEMAEKALEKFKSEGSLRGQSLAFQALADCYLSVSDCAEALALSTEAIALAWDLGDKAAEATMMNTCAGAYLLQWRFPEALRAATRAAALFKAVGDKVGEAIALETAANASVSCDPSDVPNKKIFQEQKSGPQGGQAMMDAARFGQTSILYESKPWQPIAKFHPILEKRSGIYDDAGVIRHKTAANDKGWDTSGRPLFNRKLFGWRKAGAKTDDAMYYLVLEECGKIV